MPSIATQNPTNHPAVAAAGLERRINPALVAKQLDGADLAAIAEAFVEARALGQRAWMATSVCAGIAQSRAGRGDRVLEELSRMFGLHRSRIARLGRIYRELIQPRIEEEGEAAAFVLAEQAWYEIAVEAGAALGRSVRELLGEAEDEKLADPRFSTRRWKERLGLTEHGAMADKLRAVLVRLAGVEDDVIEAFKDSPDRELLDRAADVIERAGVIGPGAIRADVDPPLPGDLIEFLVTDSRGRIVNLTPGMAARFGSTREEMLEADALDWAVDRDQVENALECLRRGTLPRLDGDYAMRNRKTGERMPMPGLWEVTINYSITGKLKGLSLHDEMTWIPIEQEDRPLGWVGVIDAEGHWSYINADFAALLGYDPNFLLHRPARELVEPGEQATLSETASDAEAVLRHSDGVRRFRMRARVFVLRAAEGDALLGIVAKIMSVKEIA